MDAKRWERLQNLFERASELPRGERDAFVAESCGDDAELRSQLEGLLFGDESGEVLDQIVAEAAEGAAERASEGAAEVADDTPAEGAVRRRIGRYELVRSLGRGGMGAVHLAVRADDAFHKQVAVKLLRQGVDSDELRARFQAERQILADLEHPHIARLLDGGTTEDGSPFVVMEYVEGVALDEYCERHALPVRDRLRLFLDVCSAVEYAHQNLIVHRDLKPANILVDASGQPRLLDFGIAKLLGDRPGGVETQTAQRMMTPAYASPEQVRGEVVRTTSDVYSLGVLLYKLLTGEHPYDLSAAAATWERVVCETEPPRPSTRVTGEPTTDRTTGIDVRAHSRALRGDLDNIVLMAMRKEPTRRYASVGQLADDIRRHLDGLPVRARPATVGYQLRKFASRHRLGVAAASLFVTMLIGFGVVMALQAQRIARERDIAETERQHANDVAEFMVGLFRVVDPSQAQGEDLRVRDLLDAGADRVRDELTDQPALQGRMLWTMGYVYTQLGAFEKADGLLAEARDRFSGEVSENAQQARRAHAANLLSLGRYDESEAMYREALDYEIQLRGELHQEVAWRHSDLGYFLHARNRYDEARASFETAERILAQTGTTDEERATLLNNVAMLEYDQGDYPRARELMEEVVEIRRRVHDTGPHPLLATTIANLADILDELQEFDRSIELHREALALREQLFDGPHPDMVYSLNGLATLLADRGGLAEAEAMMRQARDMMVVLVGEDHEDVWVLHGNLAGMARQQGRHDEAETLYRETVTGQSRIHGERSIEVAIAKNGLALLMGTLERFDESASLMIDVHSILLESLGEDHPFIAQILSNMAELETRRGHHDEAERKLREVLRLEATHRDADSQKAGRAWNLIGDSLFVRGRFQQAEEAFRTSLKIARSREVEGSLRLADPLLGLGRVLSRDRHAEAEPLLLEAHQLRTASLADDHGDVIEVRDALVELYTGWNRPGDAERYR